MLFFYGSILCLYSAALIFVFLYSMVQLHLAGIYLFGRDENMENNSGDASSYIPMVTVQLPIYNEYYVAERIIKAVAAFDYPNQKLEIQVLDDSDDETIAVVDRVVDEVKRNSSIDIKILRRTSREGYKAGALAYGLTQARGEFIAIFDADFLPARDFLHLTIPHFREQHIGVVQAAWGHLNRNYSLLTQMQAFGLDAHFSVEQQGRYNGHYFINFNGTAGVWRKVAITDSGNWQSTTLTEDLDLSYRAQLRGWKILYDETMVVPAELPVNINALKSQQYRWTKGAAETAKLHNGKVIRSTLSLWKKVHAFFHLNNSALFLCVFLIGLLSVPMLVIKWRVPQWHLFFDIISFSLISLVALTTFYLAGSMHKAKNKLRAFANFIIDFPVFLSLTLGIALHNSVAVIEGYAGIKTPFVRTPKFNVTDASPRDHKSEKYSQKKITLLTFFETAMILYFAMALAFGFRVREFGMFPFHLMLVAGYSVVTFYTLKDAWQKR